MLVLVVVAAVAGGLRGDFTDLFVYQYGGQAVLDGLAVYESGDPVTGLPFTYPPFAAVLMVPLAPLPAWLAAALWTGASVGALAAVVVLVRRALDRPAPGWMVALLTGGALALEPVWQNLTFGQINVFLMLAVLVDLVRPERRWSGVLVGIAAGVKLTPLVFVVLLVLVGRRTRCGTGGPGLRRHRRGRVRGDAGLLGDVLDRRPRRRRPGRPPGAGPQPVRVRRAHPAPRRPAADLAVARRRRAARARGPGRRRRLVAPRRPGARHLPGSAGHAARLADLVVAPLGVGGAGRAGAVGAQPVGGCRVDRRVRGPPDPVAALGQGREYGWSPPEHLVGNAYLLAALGLSVWAAALWSATAETAHLKDAGAPRRRV